MIYNNSSLSPISLEITIALECHEKRFILFTPYLSFKATNQDGWPACEDATVNRWMRVCAILDWNHPTRKVAARNPVRPCGWRARGLRARNIAAKGASRRERSNASKLSRVE